MAATLDPGLILVIIADSTDRLQGRIKQHHLGRLVGLEP